ncbi:MAG TPA: Dna2/Cas4 domain-containing protein [Candidatus Portnoybacteria bacterium]|nr:Dna2/Cas4 domain-containing protein [Candidatus Portnoybacteria bacterium]
MLRELIDQFYLDGDKGRDQDHFYITDAGKCPRQVYFKFKKAPKKDLDAKTLRIFDHGNYTHLRIMGTLFSLGLVQGSEITIPKQEIINGRADAIISLDNKPYVIEIKTASSYKFDSLTQPESDHLGQIQLYLHFFNIKDGILIYENKNTQELKEFSIKYDQKLVEELLENFKKLKEKIDNNIIPEKPTGLEPWRCNYCVYRKECNKVEKQNG